MKSFYLMLVALIFTACDSNPIVQNNPSGLRAKGSATDLEHVLSKATTSNTPVVNPAISCPNEITGYLRGISVECGALRVPENHRVENQNFLALGYLKVPKVYNPKNPLLVLEQGGPGGSSMMLAAMYLMIKKDLAKKFNILAIEQRGTPWTYPIATCEEVEKVEAQILEQTLDAAQGEQAKIKANEICLQRTAKVMDVSKISSYQIAKDIVFGAHEMGFDVFNYYGVSYGTVVGQYLIEYSKDHLANVVLDSPAVVGKLWMNDAVSNMDTLAQKKFDIYRSKHLTSLSFDEALDYFKSAAQVFKYNPLKVQVNINELNVNVVVDDRFYMDLLFQMLIMYPDDSIVKILLDTAQNAKTNPKQAQLTFGFLLPQLQLIGQNTTSIMYQSIICREFSFANLDPSEATKNWTFMPKLFGNEVLAAYSNEMNVCFLNIPKSDEDVILTSPISSNKSVLVVGGELDHVTNPQYVFETTTNMPNAHTTVFKNASHGVFVSQPCISDSITNYLLSPTGQYSNTCL